MFNTDSKELKEVLNITYQAIKQSFYYNCQRIKNLENLKISEVGSRKRTLEKQNKMVFCLNQKEDAFDKQFVNNSIKNFKFKGVPTLKKISVDSNSYKIILNNKHTKDINLIDEGSGYWILTYLIFTLANKENGNKIILIEEPETYLHPNFQAKLADLFIEACEKFGQQLIIETHSEYLIKRIQRRIAQSNKKELLSKTIFQEQDILPFNIYQNNIVINYIDNSDNCNKISKIEIDETGDLDKPFPNDFMDVSLNEDLLSLKLKNLN